MYIVDAKGQPCPIPVLMTKKQMDLGELQLSVEVDNPTAVENVSKLAASQGYSCVKEEINGGFRLILQKEGESEPAAEAEEICVCAPARKQWAVFASRDTVGDGARELGESLAKMFFFTVAEGSDYPNYVLLMNSGVKLACGDSAAVEHLQKLEAAGTQILVCGTCLNFYGISEELKVGTVSNMYDIVGCMQAMDKVINI